ncbi:MAG: enhanced serine sensitivity protein SseB C-terminal domain-containing protein [Actinobacteria bacterium]|nr:enhanced serine sensitivity protein SseB C-terminal domain-containing protein [Actinomycetota bacterium]
MANAAEPANADLLAAMEAIAQQPDQRTRARLHEALRIPQDSGSDGAGVLPVAGAPGASVEVQPPATEPPPHLLGAVSAAARELAPIRECWLFDATFDGADPHLAIGLEPAPGAEQAAFEAASKAFATAVQAAIPAGAQIDVLPLDSVLLAAVRRVGRPVAGSAAP